MPIPALKKCCCCCELETGVLTIAFLGIFGVLGHFVTILSKMPNDANGYFVAASIIGLLSVLLVYGLLVFGAIKRRPSYLLPWLVIAFIGNIIYGLVIVGFAIKMISSLDSSSKDFSAQLPFVITAIIVIASIYALSIYIYMAVYSLYAKLKNQNIPSFPLV